MLRRAWFGCLWLLISASCSTAAGPRLVIDEYLLSAPPDLSTDQLVFHFASGDQTEILARTQAYRDSHEQISKHNSQVLAPFGYRLGDYREADHSYAKIFHGDKPVASDVVFIGSISVNASKTDFIGLVDMSDGAYVFTRDRFEMRASPAGREPYAYVGDQLLSIENMGVAPGNSRLRVYLDEKLAYETSFNDISTYGSFDGPWTYGSHWALVLLDGRRSDQSDWEMLNRLVLDGHDLNAANGYEQSFQFAVVDGRPFYFFQRERKISISFDGRELPGNYDEIPHYGCCTSSLLNPGISMNMVWFFARRGAAWYYVEAYVPSRLSQ